jgi:hypothetical protein
MPGLRRTRGRRGKRQGNEARVRSIASGRGSRRLRLTFSQTVTLPGKEGWGGEGQRGHSMLSLVRFKTGRLRGEGGYPFPRRLQRLQLHSPDFR